MEPAIFKTSKFFCKSYPLIFLYFMVGLFYSLFFSNVFKRACYSKVCAIFTYFLEKITLIELFLRDSQFWEMADFF